MSNVYMVVTGEDNYGISSVDLFDTEEKARANAEAMGLGPERLQDRVKWEARPSKALANWRMGCDYVTIFLKEVN